MVNRGVHGDILQSTYVLAERCLDLQGQPVPASALLRGSISFRHGERAPAFGGGRLGVNYRLECNATLGVDFSGAASQFADYRLLFYVNDRLVGRSSEGAFFVARTPGRDITGRRRSLDEAYFDGIPEFSYHDRVIAPIVQP